MRLFLFALLIVITSTSSFAQGNTRQMLKEKTEQRLKEIIESSPVITGMVAIDLTFGESISFNPEVQFPQASSIKIPILMEVFRQAHEGKFSLSDPLAVSSENLVGGTGILKNLEDPAALSIKNLGILTIALSDNSATNALIDFGHFIDQ